MSDALDRVVPETGPKGEALYRHDAEVGFYLGDSIMPSWRCY